MFSNGMMMQRLQQHVFVIFVILELAQSGAGSTCYERRWIKYNDAMYSTACFNEVELSGAALDVPRNREPEPRVDM
jgi:hypothetical protein